MDKYMVILEDMGDGEVWTGGYFDSIEGATNYVLTTWPGTSCKIVQLIEEIIWE